MRTAFIRLLSLLLSLSCWQRAQAQDNALHFDGIDDRADTAILTNGEAATVEAWVVPEAILDPISGQIYNGNGGAVAGGPHMVLEIKDGRPVGRMWNGTTSVGWVTGNSIVTGIPTHLAYVYDHQSDRAELYVDGQLAGSASAPDPLAHTSSRVLGGHPIEPRHYRGVLDEFRLWNRGLSGTEILDRKDSCLTGTEAGLLVYYRLNQGSAGGANPGLIQVVDSSPSGVPGILSNFGLGGASSNWVAAPFGIGDCQGTNYCLTTANSTGLPAGISAVGSTSLATNDLVLSAAAVPNEPYLFFHAATRLQLPFGNGLLCAGGGVVRLNPPAVAAGGLASRVLNVGLEVGAPGIRHFQCWFRDSAAGGAAFDLSDGLSLTFVP